MNLKSVFLLLIILNIFCHFSFSQTRSVGSKIRVFHYSMNPRQYPDDNRRWIKPPDTGTFSNRIQFMALRSLDGDYKHLLDLYTIKYDLGNVIWPSYSLIYRSDLSEVVQEIKKRNLYLFDLWGYVPGSGPGGYWQQFVVPQHALNLFEKELGKRWLGMDNGEQDGRYIGGFASQMNPTGDSREQQYLNFQNHFQGLTDRLGNKMATLVSLNFGHYFLKEGVYTLIGAETAQALPNTQIYYSFIRGAGKQYGIPWFGNASVWNRWGWKNYSGILSNNGGETEGTSLSLLKRLIYSHIMYNCVAVGFESSHLNKREELSPIGKIQQSANHWVEKYGNPGILYTPVAVMLDFFSGWTFPRHLYSGNIYRVWGNLPYEDGDYLTDNILNMLYPGYQDASYFHDETGFITPTPYGDIADCILSDCPLWILQQYPVLIIGNKLNGGYEIKDKLEHYIQSGGQLIITAGNLDNMPNGLCGIKTGQKEIFISKGETINLNGNDLKEEIGFKMKELIFSNDTKIVASWNQEPLVVEHTFGAGKITVLASPFGICSQPLNFDKSEIDKNLKTPFPMLNHVKLIISDILNRTELFSTNKELSLITCRKNKGEYTVAICNNFWQEKPFQITSNAGEILKITELPLDCSEQKANGFLPKNVLNNTGGNTQKTIAGGDIRIFDVKIDENNVEDIPIIEPVSNPINRGLPLRDISSIKKEILLRPTFFQHFDRVIINWKYLSEKEKTSIIEESAWIKRQKLKVIVDFSSGINLFPDLRLVDNDSIEYAHSMDVIKSVIDKMGLLGASDLILTTHRTVENNFSRQAFAESLKSTVKNICRYAAKSGINIHLRLVTGKDLDLPEQADKLAKSVDESNFFVAPSLALLVNDLRNLNKNIDAIKKLKYSIFFISVPEKDMYGKLWNLNLPLYKYEHKEEVKNILHLVADKDLLLDAIYQDKEEEYLDISYLNKLLK